MANFTELLDKLDYMDESQIPMATIKIYNLVVDRYSFCNQG
jgi:hypothetical protein